MRRLCSLLLGLFLLGPPIPTLSRPLTAALEDPFNLSLDYAIHVGTWMFGAGVAAVLLIDPFKRWSPLPFLAHSPARWLALFAAVAAGSVVYSVAPVYTLFFAMKLWVILILTAYVATSAERGTADLLKVVVYASMTGWALLAALYVVAPAQVGSVALGTGYRLTGGFLGDYGSFALVSGIGLLASFLYGPRLSARWWLLPLYGLSWVFVLLSETRSTIAAGFLAAIALIGLHHDLNKRILALVLGSVAGVILVAGGATTGIAEFLSRGQDVQDLRELSGRVDLFQFLVDRWQTSPWLGFGYAAGGRYHLLDYVQQTGLSLGAPHDVVSKVLIDLGLAGAALLGFLYLSLIAKCFRLAMRVRYTDLYPIFVANVALLVWMTVSSAVSGGIADPSVVFVSVVVSVQALRSPSGVRSAAPVSDTRWTTTQHRLAVSSRSR